MKKAPFIFEGLGRNEPRLALRALFHAHGRPLQRFLIEIFQVLELAAGQEVGFDREEASFLAGFPIGMSPSKCRSEERSPSAGNETEAICFSKRFHLRL